MEELTELLTYINTTSPKNAAAVRSAISERLSHLREFPKTGHADRNMPLVPPGAEALVINVKKVSIYYLFPVRWRGREIVYVVSIGRGVRMPLNEPEYARRWLEELARLAPPPEEPSSEVPSED